ncbi:hypothetical protein ACWDWT_12360 [Streptomyces sp. NPDC003343]
MITLHDFYERGGDAAKAVEAFGNLHPALTPAGGPDQRRSPNWKVAEQHFLELQVLLLRRSQAPAGSDMRERERRAENAAAGLLLAIDPGAGHRCPICRLHTANA